MNAIPKLILTIAGTLLILADAHAGRWISRDPIQDGAGFVQRDPLPTLDFNFTPQNEPNLYAFVKNDGVNQNDALGLVIVGFYGADVWGSSENNGANPTIREIAKAVGAPPPYRSLDILEPYNYLLKYFSDGDGRCNANEPIKLFGHSWGGISAVKLSRWLGRSKLRNHEIDVYTIDPVRLLRLPPTSVPSSVTKFWNRYETHGGPVLGPIAIHGIKLTSYAKTPPDQQDLNPGPTDNGINHVSIVSDVQAELIRLLKQ